MHTEVSEESLNRVFFQITVPTVHLESIIYDIITSVCGHFLRHRTIHRVVWSFIGQKSGSMSDNEPRRLKFDGHLGKLKLEVLIICKGATKLFPTLYVICCNVETLSSTTKRATGNVESSSIETRESNLETLTFFTD